MLETWSVAYRKPRITSLELAWTKLDQYSTVADINPVLYAAVALNFTTKLNNMDITSAARFASKMSVQLLWESNYKNLDVPQPKLTPHLRSHLQSVFHQLQAQQSNILCKLEAQASQTHV